MAHFASALTNALLMTLLAALWLLLRRPLQRRIRPATCYGIGIILAVGLLIPMRPALPVPLLRTPAPMERLAASDPALPDTLPYDYDFSSSRHQERMAEAQFTQQPVPLDPAPFTVSTIHLWRIAAFVWAGGAAVSLLIQAVRHLRFARLVRRWRAKPNVAQSTLLAACCTALGIHRPPRLRLCWAVQSPMLVGIFRPTVLLPCQLFSQGELGFILRHELAHLKRRDLLGKAVMLAAGCLHWWNPIVHRLARAISADCEMSCDDAVLAGADLAQRKQYGETILGTILRQSTPHPTLSTYFFERGTDMKRRFASMLHMRPRRAGSLLLVACLCLTVCTGSVFATGTDTAGDAVFSPTTGMPYPAGRDDAYRPVLVEISNSIEARPQHALSLADIVWEYIQWGPGHTRYVALYNDYHPELAGSIRSTKTFGMSLRNSWDCPIAYIGSQAGGTLTNVDAFIEANDIPAAMLFDGTKAFADDPRNIFSRLTDRESPHNAVANVQQVIQRQWPADADGEPYTPALPPLRFADTPTSGGVPVTNIIIPYDEQVYLPRYSYSTDAGHYERWYNGTPQLDGLTGQRITAANVIVLYAPLSYEDNSMAQPIWELLGSGTLDVFIGGRQITGSWQRAQESDPFEFLDAAGSPLTLSPGKTFIQVVLEDMEIYVEA